jgi:hypothetical protein
MLGMEVMAMPTTTYDALDASGASGAYPEDLVADVATTVGPAAPECDRRG